LVKLQIKKAREAEKIKRGENMGAENKVLGRGVNMTIEKMYEWFLTSEFAPKSIGPHTSSFLLEVAKEVIEAVEKEKDEDVRSVLREYSRSLYLVGKLSIIQQRAVIDKLSLLVKGAKGANAEIQREGEI
jgi:hypothetical protein